MSNLAVEILRNAKARPDHPAMRTVGTTLTYAELEEEAWKAAQVLRGQGISAGDVIGLALRDSRQTYIAMLGAWLLGATCNLLDFRSSAEQRRGFAEMFAQKLLIEDGPVEGERLPISLTGWEALLDGAPAEAVAPVPSSAPAVIPVTSGTTGKPAGFPVSHEACLWRARSWRGTRAIETYKRFLSTGPMSFGANLGWVTNVLLSGGTVTFFPPMNRPRDICEVFRAHRIVSAVMVPTALRDLLAYVRETGDRIGEGEGEAMPWLVTTGAAISASELEALEEMLTPNIIQVYASSPVGATTVLFSDNFEGRRATVGRPLAGVELEIVDADDAPRAPGEIGHLRVRTPGRATAILGREAGKGGDRFKGDWYYPGDLGSLDADGYLTLAGRSTDVIIRGGVNIYPREIEVAVSAFPGVRDVAAVGYPDERAGEEIAVFAVADPGVTAEELLGLCRANLPSDKRPKKVALVASLPLNANGKVIRGKLVRQLMDAEKKSG